MHRTTPEAPTSDTPWRRVVRHAIVTIGGSGTSAVLGLGALAVATRALPPAAFGTLAFGQACALAVERLGTFQSWQALIRFGSLARQASNDSALAGLLRFGLILDVASGVLAATLGVAVVALVGGRLGWDPTTQEVCSVYAGTVIFRSSGTAITVLRLLERFELAALARAAGGLTRLLGSLAAALYGDSLWAFATAWIAADVTPTILLGLFAVRTAKGAGILSIRPVTTSVLRRLYPDLLSTLWTTNLHGTVKVVSRDLDVLLAGLFVGTSAAAYLRVARQLGGALSQLGDPLSQAIYPELAAASAARRFGDVRDLVARAASVGARVGVPIAAGFWLFSSDIVALVAGAGYDEAASALAIFAATQALALITVGISPALLALGLARRSFKVLCFSTVVYSGLLLPLLLFFGATGAGVAQFAFQATWTLYATRVLLSHLSDYD